MLQNPRSICPTDCCSNLCSNTTNYGNQNSHTLAHSERNWMYSVRFLKCDLKWFYFALLFILAVEHSGKSLEVFPVAAVSLSCRNLRVPANCENLFPECCEWFLRCSCQKVVLTAVRSGRGELLSPGVCGTQNLS